MSEIYSQFVSFKILIPQYLYCHALTEVMATFGETLGNFANTYYFISYLCINVRHRLYENKDIGKIEYVTRRDIEPRVVII